MKFVIADCRLKKKARDSLASLGYEVIALPPSPALPLPTASHPDMLLFIYRDTAVCTKDYYGIAKDELERTGLRLILSDEAVGNTYPDDILFNAALVGEHLIGNLKYVSSHIKELPLKHINTNQGYAKCSTCIVSDNAIITADPSVASAAKGAGIDVLTVLPGNISLPGYDCGFIGGASGVTDDFVAFCGNIDLHPNASEIKAFCKKYKKEAVSLSDGELHDVGTLFFIER